MMDSDFQLSTWAEDLSGLSFDELRELPYDVVARLDMTVFE